MIDAARLAVGTLTALPVRPPAHVDRAVAGWAMALAPAVGAGLGVMALLAVLLLQPALGPLLVAVLVVGMVGATTRLIHWDGLADTADGLGSARPPDAALEVMRRSDVGPFGVVVLVIVLLAQVAAVADLVAAGSAGAVVLASTLGRAALLAGCRSGVPAARRSGLGVTVTGSVTPSRLLAGLVTTAVVAVTVGVVGFGPAAEPATAVVAAVLATAIWAVAATAYLRRRLGGMTGDTLGALVETSTAVALVVLAAG